MASQLEIKIQAFVTGLQQIQQLASQLQNLSGTARTAGNAAAGAATGTTTLGNASQGAARNVASVAQAASQSAGGMNAFQKAFADISSSASSMRGPLSAVETQLSSLTGMAKTAVAGFVALAGALTIKAAADTAARVETLGVTLNVVGNNAGYSEKQISGYEEELKKLGITTQGAREAMIGMIQSNLELGPVAGKATSQVAELARAAQDLAVVTGENSSQTLTRLITNISQLDTMGLRFMGVVINMDQAMEKYAASVGKSAGALSTMEKQQAVTNAVLEKSKGLTGAYEKSLDTVGKKIASLSRYYEEAKRAIGDNLLPAYAVIVDAATAFLKKVQETSDAMAKQGTVAETLKSVMQTVFEVAGAIGTAIMGVFEGIAPAVQSIAETFQSAFKGFVTSGLQSVLDGAKEAVIRVFNAIAGVVETIIPIVRDVFDVVAQGASDSMGIVDSLVTSFEKLANMISSALEESRPAIANVASALMDVVSSVGEAFGAVGELVGAFSDASEGGSTLKTIIEALGLIVAGFADGIKILTGVFAFFIEIALKGIGSLIGGFGQLASWAGMKELGDGMEKFGEKLFAVGEAAGKVASRITKDFTEGNTAVAHYTQRMEESEKATKNAALAAAEVGKANKEAQAEAQAAAQKHTELYKQAEEEVRKLAEAQRTGKLKGDEFAAEYKKVQGALVDLAKQGNFTQKEIDALGAKMSSVATKDADKLDEEFKKLGTTQAEFAKQVTNAAQSAVGAFNSIAQSGKFSADQIYQAFKTGLDMSKTLGDLKNFKESLDQAYKSGQIGAQEYGSAVQLVSQKFEQLFQAQLKAAKTKEDFQQLTDTVRKMGAEGTISATQMATALKQIGESANGSRAEMIRLSQEAVNLGKAALEVTQAEAGVQSANIDLQKAKNQLLKAENNERQQGTELSRAETAAARASVAAAEAKLAVQQAILAAKQAELEMTKAQAELAAAEAAYAKDASAANAAAVQAAKEEVDAKMAAANAAQAAVSAAQQVAVETSSAAEAAKAYAENMAEAAQAAGNINTQTSSSMQGVSVAAESWDSLVGKFKQVGLSLQEAEAAASSFVNKGQLIVAFGDQGVRKYMEIQEAVQAAKKHVEEMAEQQRQMSEAAGKMREKFQDITNAAQDAALGLSSWGSSANEVAKAYAEIRRQAASAAKSAVDAARSFISSTSSIHEELLQAQGREEEAAALRFANRKKELALQYQQLQIQIQIARVQAKAAGVSTAELDQYAQEASKSYGQALSDLDKLQQIELEKIRTTRQASLDAKMKELDALKQKQLELDKDAKASQSEKNALLEQERKLREEIAKTGASGGGGGGGTPAQTQQIQNSTNQVLQSIAANASAASATPSPGMATWDWWSKSFQNQGTSMANLGSVTLNVGDRSTQVMTQDSAGLLKTLEGLRGTAINFG